MPGKGNNRDARSKFTSSNNNKRWNPDTRYNYFCGKKSKKQYSSKVVARKVLEDKNKQTVKVNAEIKYLPKDPLQPVLLEHLYVDKEYVDHTWVKMSVADRRKLRFWNPSTRILFTATVIKYEKVSDREVKVKYGLIDVKLNTSI